MGWPQRDGRRSESTAMRLHRLNVEGPNARRQTFAVLCFPCGLVRGGGAASPPEAPPQTRSLFLADKVIKPLL